MTQTRDILQAIADALAFSRSDLVWILLITLAVLVLFVVAAVLQRMLNRRHLVGALQERFEREIRRLDVTVRELDVLNSMAKCLRDPSKKYLLISNQNTFFHCARAVGKLAPPLDSALLTLQARLGFAEPAGVALGLGAFVPAAGSEVKLERRGDAERVLAEVVQSKGRRVLVRLQTNPGLKRGEKVDLYASHPSGIVVAEAELETVAGVDAGLSITRPFAEPNAGQLRDSSLKVFIRRELETGTPRATEIRAIWSTGAVLDNPNRAYRKHDDLQIVLRRNHAKWVYVNAEVVSVRHRKRLLRVRFSHLSSDVRREVLGAVE